MSGLKRAAATETSVSLDWNVPVLQNQHHVLDYQVRYSPKVNTPPPTLGAEPTALR